jgi:hypothetical protein
MEYALGAESGSNEKDREGYLKCGTQRTVRDKVMVKNNVLKESVRYTKPNIIWESMNI